MIEFIADKLYELITSKGVDFIEQLKAQYNNQVILYGIIKRFGEGDYFRQEYRNLTYIDRKDIVLQISEDKISPTLEVEEISRNIHDIILHTFIGDNGCIDKIEKIIVSEYLSKRKLTIELIDLAVMEKKNTDEIFEKVEEVKQVVEKINYVNECKKHRKDQILKCGLGRKIDLFISEATKHYLYWVNKGNVTSKGNEIPVTIQYFDQIEELIKNNFIDITEEFYKQPIKIQIIDRLPFEIKEVSPIDYMLYVRTLMEKKTEELLRMSDMLPDDFFCTMIEYMDLFVRNPMYYPDNRQFMQIVVNSKSAKGTDMRKAVVDELIKFGEIVLKFKPMYNLWIKYD